MADLLENYILGLSVALSLNNLLYCAIGVTLGTVIGVIPGFGTLAAMSMLFPITFYMDPTAAIIMLGGIWYGTSYGGSTASILLNLPGTPANAVACLDGYPMAKQGRAGVALFMTTIASCYGGSIGILLMMLFSPTIVYFAHQFGPAEYFALMVLGLVIASVISEGSALKGLAMVVLGILMGVVGIDTYTGAPRLTFGMYQLMDGLSLIALAMGLFGVSEVIASIREIKQGEVSNKVTLRSMLPTRDDMRRSWLPMTRGTAIGSFFGVLPGAGAAVASFMSYTIEKQSAKDPGRFGKGAVEGIVAPEAANNAADQTSFIPTMTLGIPGTPHMALILGVLMIHGINPGPGLMTDNPEIFWGIVMSFWIGNILLVILNIPLIGLWLRILMIPYHILYPSILMFVCIGMYTINNSQFEIYTVILFGLMGYVLRFLGFPLAPLLLGFVLGPMLEEHFRRAMLISGGNLQVFMTRPLSFAILLLTVFLLALALWGAYRARMRLKNAPAE